MPKCLPSLFCVTWSLLCSSLYQLNRVQSFITFFLISLTLKFYLLDDHFLKHPFQIISHCAIISHYVLLLFIFSPPSYCLYPLIMSLLSLTICSSLLVHNPACLTITSHCILLDKFGSYIATFTFKI